MNQDNPFQMLLGTMGAVAHDSQADGPTTGTVAGLAPLTVTADGLELSGADLMVNPELLFRSHKVRLADITGSLSVTCSGCGECEGGPADLTASSGDVAATLTLPGTLAIGDRVFLVPLGPEPTYYLLCKVVAV